MNDISELCPEKRIIFFCFSAFILFLSPCVTQHDVEYLQDKPSIFDTIRPAKVITNYCEHEEVFPARKENKKNIRINAYLTQFEKLSNNSTI